VIINDLLDARLAFLRRLSTFRVFGRGWTRRVNDVRATAQQLAEGDTAKSAANAAPDVAFPVLRRGSNGDWVSKVQQVLDIAVDGDFGPVTERAVKTFQEQQGLEPDGIVGRLTYRAMGLIA
jgi:peptidoglycan hydrolase-like protein with peptidoglycan-binding domain